MESETADAETSRDRTEGHDVLNVSAAAKAFFIKLFDWGRGGSKRVFKYIFKAVAELTAVALGLGVIWFALLVSVMAKGEADVSFLKQNFALWFAQAYDGQEADISTFKVQWHPERDSLGFLAEGIIVKDDAQAPLLTVNSIYTETPVTALLNRGFEARRLDLDGGQFTVRRDEDGAMYGAIGGPETFGRLGPIIPIAGGGGTGGGGLIDSVSLIGTEVFFRDLATGLSLDLRDVEFLTENSDEDVFAKGNARLRTGEHFQNAVHEHVDPYVNVSILREVSGDKALDVVINVSGINPSDVVFDNKDFIYLKQVDIPLNLKSKWRSVSARGRPIEREVVFEVEKIGEAGGVTVPVLGRVNEFVMGGRWDGVADSLELNNIDIRIDDNYFNGQVKLLNITSLGDKKSSNRQQSLSFDIGINELSWPADGVLAKPLNINKGEINGSYSSAQGRLDLSSISLPIAEYRIVAAGYVENFLLNNYFGDRSSDGQVLPLGLALNGAFEGQLSEAEFLNLWPVNFILGGRNWVKGSVVEATLSEIKFNVDIDDFSQINGGLADDAITMDFKVDNGWVHYIRTMPPMGDVSARGRLRANGLSLDVISARVGDLFITSGGVEIPQFFPYGNDFTLEFEGSGPLNYLVELVDKKPFEYASLYNLSPQDFSGHGVARLKVTRPLRENFDQNRIRYEVEVSGSDVDAPFGLGDFQLTEGTLYLSADKTGMSIKGPAKIGPIDANINWRENFDFGATPTELNLTGRIDNAVLDKLGVSLREYFGGEVPFELQASGQGVDFNTATIRADLSQSEWVFGDLWSKPAEKAGELVLSISRNSAGLISVDDLTASAPGLQLQGGLTLSEDLRLLAANLNSVMVDDLISARVTVNREAVSDPLKTTLSGDFLNLDGVINADIWNGDDTSKVPVLLSANVNTLRLASNYQINKASLVYQHSGERIEQFRFSGGNEDGAVIVDLQTHDDGPNINSLKFDIADASAAAGAFFKLDNISGGRLYGEAIRPRDNPNLLWSGTINVDDFTLVKAPVLAQILSLASLNGLGNVLNGDGLEFETIELPFTWGGGTLGLEAARAAGPALGLTGDGQIDISNKMIDIDGTLIPAYAANSFFGSIPILGDIFGGKADDAALGLTYNVDGSFAEAKVGVNPLSALTPGILRQIFKPKREKKRVATPSEKTDIAGNNEAADKP